MSWTKEVLIFVILRDQLQFQLFIWWDFYHFTVIKVSTGRESLSLWSFLKAAQWRNLLFRRFVDIDIIWTDSRLGYHWRDNAVCLAIISEGTSRLFPLNGFTINLIRLSLMCREPKRVHHRCWLIILALICVIHVRVYTISICLRPWIAQVLVKVLKDLYVVFLQVLLDFQLPQIGIDVSLIQLFIIGENIRNWVHFSFLYFQDTFHCWSFSPEPRYPTSFAAYTSLRRLIQLLM